MKKIASGIIFVVLMLLAAWLLQSGNTTSKQEQSTTDSTQSTTATQVDQVVQEQIAAKADLIRLTVPKPGVEITSPLTIIGEARGYWFFEASFPVVLTDWDGRIIAEDYATAEGEWMTEEFVPFTVELEFESPYQPGDDDFMKNGSLILRKDNPSGLPQHDNALEIPVQFAPAK